MSIKIYDGTIKWTLRETVEETTIACTPEAVVQYMKGAFDAHPEQEQFWVLFLNRKNAIKGRMMITLGTLNSTLVAPPRSVPGGCARQCGGNHRRSQSPQRRPLAVTCGRVNHPGAA
jgi:hypothetical protein